jgi:lipid-binding SYLF domain-containing protein
MKLSKSFFSVSLVALLATACGSEQISSNLNETQNPYLTRGEASRVSKSVANSARGLQLALTATSLNYPYNPVVSHDLLERTICIASLKVHRGAILLGGNGGDGLMSCRLNANEWSAPSFVRTGGFELSAGIGYKQMSIVYFITDPVVANNFKGQGQFSLRPYASAVAADAGVAIRNANQYGVAAVQLNDVGLYAGVGISISSMSHMTGKRNQAVYADTFATPTELPPGVPRDRYGMPCSEYALEVGRAACIREWNMINGRNTVVSVEQILSLPASGAPMITKPWNDTLRGR